MTTLSQFIEYFNTLFYAATTVDSMGWTDREICGFLNSAQLQLVEELAAVGNVDGISNLVVRKKITLNIDNVVEHALPIGNSGDLENYFYYLSGIVTLVKAYPKTIGYRNFPLEKISILDVPKFTASINNMTYFRNPKIALGNNYPDKNNTGEMFTLIVDVVTTKIKDVTISYIEKPQEFNDEGVNGTITNINESLHNRIVLIAVEMAVKSMLGTPQSTQ